MKVVTIDFDIIMEPSIIFYNHIVPSARWEDLYKNAIPNLFTADLIHYERLTKWVINMFHSLPAENVQFIYSHDMAYELLKDYDNIELINIDHHHDYGYDKGDNSKVTCANWVKYLAQENHLASYLWVNNESSDVHPNATIDSQCLKKTNLSTLNPDILIICLSPEWVPPHIRPLFDLWTDFYEQQYKQKCILLEREGA